LTILLEIPGTTVAVIASVIVVIKVAVFSAGIPREKNGVRESFIIGMGQLIESIAVAGMVFRDVFSS